MRYGFTMAETPELIVYTSPDCCLCDDAKAALAGLAPRLGVTVRYVDISGDAELERTWREQLPAGVFAGKKVFKYHVDAVLLERRVAAWRVAQAAG